MPTPTKIVKTKVPDDEPIKTETKTETTTTPETTDATKTIAKKNLAKERSERLLALYAKHEVVDTRIEQMYLDNLFDKMYTQNTRAYHTLVPAQKAVETKLLDIYVGKYKKYYINKANYLLFKLERIWVINAARYLYCYDTVSDTKMEQSIENNKTFVQIIKQRSLRDLLNEKIPEISTRITRKYPDTVLHPSFLMDEYIRAKIRMKVRKED